MKVILKFVFVAYALCQINDTLTQPSSDQLALKADTIHTALLHGGVNLGYYYVNIFVGTPPKKQTVIVDTGSATTTFPCNDCQDCGKHIDQQFDFTSSTTAYVLKCQEQIGATQCTNCDQQGRCSFSISFAEQSSLQGYFIRDYVLFGDVLYDLYQETQQQSTSSFLKAEDEIIINREHFKTVFGCTTRETNLFRTQQADGIMGLSPRTNTSGINPNVVDDLFSKLRQEGQHLQFSLCYSNNIGGYMSIGGYDKHRQMPNVTSYTIPYYNNLGQFRIKINDVKIGNVSLGLQSDQYDKGHGSFIDSGTTLVYAHPAIFNAFQSNYQSHCDSNNNDCPNLQLIQGQFCFKYQKESGSLQDFFKKFPTIYFDLEQGFVFDWRPEDYLYLDTFLTTDPDTYCSPLNSYQDRFILGGIWMRSWDILFDRQNEQIQFTRSKCSNSKIHTQPHKHDQDADQSKTSEVSTIDELDTTTEISNESTTDLDTSQQKYIVPQHKLITKYLVHTLLIVVSLLLIIFCVFVVRRIVLGRTRSSVILQQLQSQNTNQEVQGNNGGLRSLAEVQYYAQLNVLNTYQPKKNESRDMNTSLSEYPVQEVEF